MNRQHASLAAALGAFGLAGLVLFGPLPAAHSAAAGHVRRHVTLPTPSCATEDSVSCYWDAGRRGNHRGYSFWTDAAGDPHYLDPAMERRSVRVIACKSAADEGDEGRIQARYRACERRYG